MSFSEEDKTKILRLKSSIASYYNLQMKKIGDRHLESFFYDHCVISGGMIASLFHDEAVNDIDIYCKSPLMLNSIKDYIINSGKNIKSIEKYEIIDGVKVVDPTSAHPLITDNAVTLTNDIQYIYLDIWKNSQDRFDYIHCQPYYDIKSQKLFISEAQYNSIKNKLLIPTGKVEIKDKRREKYVKRGWGEQQIKPVEFVWNDDGQIGIIAQEIGKLIPQTMYINIPT